ncbi:hypothetical protein FRACYDRAFT_236553 [Fragilariopsis cylindrus CCMP1102]|uniref:Transmembrane protein n=1 Tax=Fragilariopsis cylindrus CCMP1102 TaxID=635003 RepID=A0A1E7FJD4_9STRA|nr:hypothetical protein FRACYDRAFT_236553 [Fragilariopsis cylindrus CCMP1102]|eukprot:OEU18276.1 hypothetical protein FRACYDRAFT_236553 [Fragilariopsis cylindrus CCMP1102]
MAREDDPLLPVLVKSHRDDDYEAHVDVDEITLFAKKKMNDDEVHVDVDDNILFATNKMKKRIFYAVLVVTVIVMMLMLFINASSAAPAAVITHQLAVIVIGTRSPKIVGRLEIVLFTIRIMVSIDDTREACAFCPCDNSCIVNQSFDQSCFI